MTLEEKKAPRILLLDIETKPLIVYAWRMYEELNSLEKVIDTGGLLCFAAKWLGEKEKHFYSEWEHGRDVMVKAAHKLLSEADAVVTYNGEKFDLPKLQAEFVMVGTGTPPPLTSIDVYKTTKTMGFVSKKLDFVAKALGCGQKVEHEGMALWHKVLQGNSKARKKMKKYNIGDVTLLEKVYLKIRPFIKNHPHMGFTPKRECGACGSSKMQSRGFRRTRAMRIQRLHCQECGSWMDGLKQKV